MANTQVFGSDRWRRSNDLPPVQTTDTILEVLPLRDQVADIVRRMILRGQLLPDERISERQIGKMLGISTTPVKEAFRTLQAEGLIHSEPRVGSFVSPIPRDHMYQIVAMRGALEGVAANFAAANHTPEELAGMTACMTAVKKLLKDKSDPLLVAAQNAKFHEILRNACRNNYLITLILTMRSIDKTFREMSLAIDEQETRRAYAEHSAILQAVAARDSGQSELLMNRHIRRVAQSVVNLTVD